MSRFWQPYIDADKQYISDKRIILNVSLHELEKQRRGAEIKATRASESLRSKSGSNSTQKALVGLRIRASSTRQEVDAIERRIGIIKRELETWI